MTRKKLLATRLTKNSKKSMSIILKVGLTTNVTLVVSQEMMISLKQEKNLCLLVN